MHKLSFILEFEQPKDRHGGWYRLSTQEDLPEEEIE